MSENRKKWGSNFLLCRCSLHCYLQNRTFPLCMACKNNKNPFPATYCVYLAGKESAQNSPADNSSHLGTAGKNSGKMIACLKNMCQQDKELGLMFPGSRSALLDIACKLTHSMKMTKLNNILCRKERVR